MNQKTLGEAESPPLGDLGGQSEKKYRNDLKNRKKKNLTSPGLSKGEEEEPKKHLVKQNVHFWGKGVR